MKTYRHTYKIFKTTLFKRYILYFKVATLTQYVHH